MQDYLIMKDDFKFDKILRGGYDVYEDKAVIGQTKLSNGKIKKVYANYEECEIEIKFGGLNADEISTYYNKFVDGTYTYWSIKDKMYKTANFLVEKPSLTMEFSYDEMGFDDFTIKLTKSSEV